MTKVHFDYETYSECDIRKAGAYAYAIHPSTRILCMGYAYEDGPPQLWVPGDIYPEFVTHPERYELHAWNSFFEWVIWTNCFTMIDPGPLANWHDTAALASVMALPRALGACGKALGMPSNVSKDKRGYELIRLLSIPNKMNGDPKLTKEMHEYCLQDVVAERAIAKKLYSLNSIERRVWVLDQKINIKGIAVDIENVNHAIDLYDKAFTDLKDRLIELTGLANPNSQKQFFDWMIDKGHMIKDITKGTLSAILEDHDDLGTHEAIRLRMKMAKTAPKKYKSILTRLGGGTRLHGNMMYHGATTGRWASTGVNLQNIARPTLDADLCIKLLNTRDPDIFKMNDLEPMDALSSSIRGMLIPSDGKKFIIGDYSSIESRVLAWLAGQKDKLEVFRGHGKMYEYLASKIFKKDIDDVTKDERFVGKIGELACGYGGGAGALQGMAEVYKVPMAKKDAQRIKQQWRKANPAITAYWYKIEEHARKAVQNEGVQEVRGIKFALNNNFLVCQLPSGRRLYYHRPQIVNKKVVMYKTPETEDSPEMTYLYSPHEYTSLGDFYEEAEKAGVEPYEFIAMNIEFWGVNSQTKKWNLTSTYGGKLVENITQAVARDIMAEAMLALDDAGYEIVLTVHDEIISEVDTDGERDVQAFTHIMEETPGWAKGLPVGVEAYESRRYRK
jgi:DNA polymerase